MYNKLDGLLFAVLCMGLDSANTPEIDAASRKCGGPGVSPPGKFFRSHIAVREF